MRKGCLRVVEGPHVDPARQWWLRGHLVGAIGIGIFSQGKQGENGEVGCNSALKWMNDVNLSLGWLIQSWRCVAHHGCCVCVCWNRLEQMRQVVLRDSCNR